LWVSRDGEMGSSKGEEGWGMAMTNDDIPMATAAAACVLCNEIVTGG